MAIVWSRSLTADNNNWSGYGMRTKHISLSGGGDQIRARFVASSSQVLAVAHIGIAKVGSATWPNTQVAPIELKFGGANGFSIAAGATITSDWLDFPFTSSDTIVVTIGFVVGAAGVKIDGGGSGNDAAFKAGGAGDALLATVSGYSNNGFTRAVDRIEGQFKISGTIAATEGADTSAIAGDVLVKGTANGTDRPDVASLAGSVRYVGTFAAVDGADTGDFEGIGALSGSLSADDGADAAAANGKIYVIGSLSAGEGADACAIDGDTLVSGVIDSVDGADGLDFTGDVIITGLANPIDGADAAVLAGLVLVFGSFASVDIADALDISGSVPASGTLSAVDIADAGSFEGLGTQTGDLAAGEGADQAAMLGLVLVQGSLAGAEGADEGRILGGRPVAIDQADGYPRDHDAEYEAIERVHERREQRERDNRERLDRALDRAFREVLEEPEAPAETITPAVERKIARVAIQVMRDQGLEDLRVSLAQALQLVRQFEQQRLEARQRAEIIEQARIRKNRALAVLLLAA